MGEVINMFAEDENEDYIEDWLNELEEDEMYSLHDLEELMELFV